MAFGTKYSLKVTSIAALAAAMGMVAVLLGFIAERKRINADAMVWDNVTSKCNMPANKTFSLAMAAAFLLLLMQVLLTAAGGCLCCNYKIDMLTSPAPLAVKSLIVSWVLCILAVIFYFYGASVSSNRHARPLPRPFLPAATSTPCGYAISSGVFASAALMTFLATASGITYYLAASRVYIIHTWFGQPKFCFEVEQPTGSPLPAPLPLTIVTTT
ncbi:hypothetical protein M758_1G017800 [Ceratodon purpureus]|nr:hypothetical protein M758_1G017800 [Ceratodon purpureus]